MQSLDHALNALTELGRHGEPMSLNLLAARSACTRAPCTASSPPSWSSSRFAATPTNHYAVGFATAELGRVP